jgi:hypothetical protein
MAARDYIIAFNNTGTGLMSLRIPAWDDPTRSIADDDAFLEHIRIKDVPSGMTGSLVLLSDIAALDRYFRNAWEWSD